MDPLVSIIVPVYNGEAWIARCVQSVLTQEFTEYELILVDDGSKDASAAMLDAYAKEDARVRVIHKPNGGVSSARNAALDIAKGTYVQFMDADDWIPSDSTKLLYQSAVSHDADMVIADFWRVVGDRVSQKGDIEEEQEMDKLAYVGFMQQNPADFYYGALWNKLFRRSKIEAYQLRMDESLSWCEAFVFNLEFILHVEKIFALRAPVYYYVKTSGSLVNTRLKFSRVLRMKLDMLEYYNEFYMQLYDEKSYRKKRGELYRFLIDVAGDGGAIAMSLGTKKLGKEVIPAVAASDMLDDNFFTELYYQDKLLARYLTTVANRFDLELRDVRILCYLIVSQGTRSTKAIKDFTGYSQVVVTTSLRAMTLRHFVHFGKGRPALISLGSESKPVVEAIGQVLTDFQRVSEALLSQQERVEYRKLRSKSIDGIKQLLLTKVEGTGV